MKHPPSFFSFPKEEQTEIILASATQLGMEPHVVEKDLWVCWALEKLFALPNHLPMAFKGGTSLSKAYKVIHRFSEDIDITIDYSAFDNSLKNPFASHVSKSALKKLSDNLRIQLAEYVQNVIQPYFETISQQELNGQLDIMVDKSGEKFNIKYPSVMPNSYLKEGVLLEFGARNVTTPNESFTIHSFLHSLLPEEKVALPTAKIPVLSAQRTFWEKATLIHVECSKNKLNNLSSPERYSRHWYDLALLFGHDIGKQAIDNHELLQEVVQHKKVFFNRSDYNYDACLDGNLRLIPHQDDLAKLEQDYNAMINNGMFFTAPPKFSVLIEELQEAEKLINMANK